MKVFSRSAVGYAKTLRIALLALLVVGSLRFLLGPLGVPIEAAGKAVSLTVVFLAAILIHGFGFGWGDGKLGDVLVTAFGLTLVYTAVLALFLPLSAALGWQTYYLDPAHIRPGSSIGGHLVAHLQAAPFIVGIGTVLGSVAFGIGWVAKRLARGKGKTVPVG